MTKNLRSNAITRMVAPLTLLLMLAIALPANAIIYSKLIVNSDNGTVGVVGVSTKDNVNPTSNSANATQNSSGLKATNHTYYVKAAVTAEYSDTWEFEGWYEGDNRLDIPASSTYTFSASNTLPTSPTTKTLTAKFKRIPTMISAETGSSAVRVAIDKPQNKVGDVVTLSADMSVSFEGVSYPNSMMVFDGWFGEDGTCLSTNQVYSFEVTGANLITARAHNKYAAPAVGNYYRIRAINGLTLSLQGNFHPSGTTTTMDTKDANIETQILSWKEDDMEDPSTIFYLSNIDKTGSVPSYHFNAQGNDLETLLRRVMSLYSANSSNFSGYFWSKSYNGSSVIKTRGMQISSDANNRYVSFNSNANDNDEHSVFAFEPVDEANFETNCLGVTPDNDMQFEGGYWTTMYTAFPYECRDGIEAYYISDVRDYYGTTLLVLTQIAGGRVPANEAVILKCTGVDNRANRLLPLNPGDAALAPLAGNLLKGSYQLNTNTSGNKAENFNGDSMRLFGLSSLNGKTYLGFVNPAATPQASMMRSPAAAQLIANKAYLDVNAVREKGYELSDNNIVATDDMATGILTIGGDATPVKVALNAVYDLQGNRVSNPLPGNIYIINGKKTKL